MAKQRFLLLIILIVVCLVNTVAQENPVDESQLLLDSPSPAQAQGSATDQNQTNNNPPQTSDLPGENLNNFSFFDLLKMILVLGGVIGAIYGLFYLLKKAGGPKLKQNDLIEVLSSKVLMGSRFLHIVQIGNEFFLLGSSDTAVNILSKLEDKETIDEIRLHGGGDSSGKKGDFLEIFSTIFRKGRGAVAKDRDVLPELDDSVDFIKKQKERLKDL